MMFACPQTNKDTQQESQHLFCFYILIGNMLSCDVIHLIVTLCHIIFHRKQCDVFTQAHDITIITSRADNSAICKDRIPTKKGG